MGYYEDFVYGFLANASIPTTFGRPVGLLILKDGSLLFTDDANNRIYQVQYNDASRSYFVSIILFIICMILTV
jgi:glucose/arabinose dehydrogenase